MIKRIETRPTSRRTAVCNPITLREGPHVRLVFVPTVVDNPADPNSCIDGQFVYQRKAQKERWLPAPTESLSSIREGEEFKLTLHASELRALLEGLVPLYRLHRGQGIPTRMKTFIEVDRGLANLITEGGADLTALLRDHPGDAPRMFVNLVNWISTSPDKGGAVEKLASAIPEQMPTFTALLGMAAIKNALGYWKQHESETSEEFWQQALTDRAYVLSQLFAYPVVVIGTKAYVGGKVISRLGGKEADFLLVAESTNSVIIVEIKTPQTPLLGSEYRGGVFPLSRELSGAVAQVLRYRQLLSRTFDSLTAEIPTRLTMGEPRCVVIAGSSKELSTQPEKENFELQRDRVRGVTIMTFDELFLKIDRLVSLLEGQ